MARRTILYLSLTVLCIPYSDLYALCGQPQPRLVCAEASQSDAVVTAKLLSSRSVSSQSDSNLNVYQLRYTRILKGAVAQNFSVYERNDSGRSGVDWKVGREYLLFLSHSPQEGAYVVEACTNSALLSHSSKIISEVEAVGKSHVNPVIYGRATTSNWATGVEGAEIVAAGASGTFAAHSDLEGRFSLRVNPGSYAVTAKAAGWTFQKGLLTYEDPDHLDLNTGTCAQIQFEGKPRAFLI